MERIIEHIQNIQVKMVQLSCDGHDEAILFSVTLFQLCTTL